MSRYLRNDGTPTNDQDQDRELWYSAGCGYWTDDWSKLKAGPIGIPCCPDCGCPGYQVIYHKWMAGAKKYEESGPARYSEFLQLAKEKCGGRNFSFTKAYEEWLKGAKAT